MPLNEALEELLKTLGDDKDREAARGLLEKHQILRDGYLRQADYDRNMNKTKEERAKEQAEIEKNRAYVTEVKDWETKNKPRHAELLKMYEEKEAELKKAQEDRELAVAAAAAKATAEGGQPVNVDELTKKVDEAIAKRGYVSEAALPKLIAEETRKLVAEEGKQAREDFYKKDFTGAMSYILAMNDLQYNHRDEFKKPLDTAAFSEFMTKNAITDPRRAYESYVSDTRRQAEIEKVKVETRAEMEKEFASKHNLPGSGAPPISELGVVQARHLNKMPELPADAEPGDNRLAYAAAAALRADGKF